MLAIRGRIHDATNKPLPEEITVEAFERSFLSSLFDRHLGQNVSVDGNFEIVKRLDIGINPAKVYLVITDPRKGFDSVREGQNQFQPFTDSHGNRKWKSEIIEGVENVDVTISFQRRPAPSDQYEAVVVGSGFGGTIVSLTLANRFASEAAHDKRVCVLERGQWWVSHKMPTRAEQTADGQPTLRGYLEENNIPYGTWPFPDDSRGLLRAIASMRAFNPVRGLYDFRGMKNIGTIAASGVGGGSLIYFNLTTRPDPSTYHDWAVQVDGHSSLETRFSYRDAYGEDGARERLDDPSEMDEEILDYFDVARDFIGVNKITTYAGLGRFSLARTRVFQQSTLAVNSLSHDLMNENELDADLSITDVPDGIFDGENPTRAAKARLSREANVCEREGRCGLGCIAEARHTMSERLYDAIREGKPIEIFPLCTVDRIEENQDSSGYRYDIYVTDFRDDMNGIKRRVQANIVVLSAGAIGSTEILLRSKELQTSDALGRHFSTNGDTFGIVSPTKEIVDAGTGPLLTSIARFKDTRTNKLEFSIEDMGIPKMFSEMLPSLVRLMILQKKVDSVVPQTNLINLVRQTVMKKIADPRTSNELFKILEGLDISSSQVLTDRIAGIIDDINGMTMDERTRAESPEERLYNVMVLFGMARDDSTGHLTIDGDSQITLKEPYNLEQPIYSAMIERMKLFAGGIGRDGQHSLVMPFWDEHDKLQLTAHPLGGCPMGRDASEGVVNGLGRLYRGKSGDACYEGFYVADGSIIPTSLGVNPSLTISALAFMIAEVIAGDKVFWPV